jgi:hypothetical protein
MDKAIYELLNEVEVDLEQYKKEELTELEKKKMKNNFKKATKQSFKYKKAVSAAAVIAIVGVSMFGTHLGVYAYESANLVFHSIGSYLGIEKELQDYTTVVHQAVTKQGITVQLNEVILDKDEFVISTTSTSDEKIDQGSIHMNNKIYVNGKRINYGGTTGSSKSIDDYTVEDITTSDLDVKDLKGDLDVKIVFESAYLNEQTKKGPWVFEFKTNGDELAASTKEISLNKTFVLENGQKIILEKYTSNALGQKIYFSKETKGTTYDMVLRGQDDLGNAIEFYASRQSASEGLFKLSASKVSGSLNQNAKVLTLTLYAVKFPETSGRLNNDFQKVGDAFTIDLSK